MSTHILPPGYARLKALARTDLEGHEGSFRCAGVVRQRWLPRKASAGYVVRSMTVPTTVSSVEQQVRARLEELRPLAEEYEQLCEVLLTFERARQPGAGSLRTRRRRTRGGGTGVSGS